jgi:hypothetical protein
MSDQVIFTNLKARCLQILYGRYTILYGYLASFSNEQLLELYYDYTDPVHGWDWSTLEQCKINIDAHIIELQEQQKKGSSSDWDNWARMRLGKIGYIMSNAVSMVGLGNLPDKDFCNAYIDKPEDQKKLFELFLEYRAEVKALEERQFGSELNECKEEN